jgi:hypothetical protein
VSSRKSVQPAQAVEAQIVRRLPELEGKVHAFAADLCVHALAPEAIGPLASTYGLAVEEHSIFSRGGLPCQILLVREVAGREPLGLLLSYPASPDGPAVQTLVFRYSGSNDIVYGTRRPDAESVVFDRPKPEADLARVADRLTDDPPAFDLDAALVVEEEPVIDGRGALVRLVLVRVRETHEPLGAMLGVPADPRHPIKHLSLFGYAGVHRAVASADAETGD